MKKQWMYLLSLTVSLPAVATTPLQLQRQYESQSGPASVQRGQQFFTKTQGKTWSCSTCHGAVPTGMGEHAETQKRIKPLAPQVNPKRFSDEAKVEKWFKRNCDDVLGRECTSQQKADVIAWLLTLK